MFHKTNMKFQAKVVMNASIYSTMSTFIITVIFFRKWAPTLIVLSGMALGTILTMGFAKLTLGELNLVTSIIGAILMGFGIDYGIHFIYRTRIELGMGKPWDQAITHAIINAGRPALMMAWVIAWSHGLPVPSSMRVR